MSAAGPILLWLRRDFRLGDNPALAAAAATGRPVIPVFVRDPLVDALGAAPKWRLGRALGCFDHALQSVGSRLILRSGPASEVLTGLAAETGADAIFWNRLYEAAPRDRDTALKAALKQRGLEAKSFAGTLLAEPWEIATGQGGPYRVFTPFWKALRARGAAAPAPTPATLAAPPRWPGSEALEDWQLGTAMRRGGEVVAAHARIGEAAAEERLAAFLDGPVDDYGADRDRIDRDGTSGLGAHLALGEIGIRRLWQAGLAARAQGRQGAEAFLRQLAWRDFAHHLAFHTPALLTGNWRADWDGFPWDDTPDRPEVLAWKQGRTGVPLVDAGMREMQVTGTMHNRARMVAASYLTKHLLAHWRIGLHWFEDHLVDWDPANNAMGWQWVAGSGPDAAPFFRIFNPETQRARFDPDGAYVRRWIAEGQADPPETALAFFRAVPQRWGLGPGDSYPAKPVVALDVGRKRALDAYQRFKQDA
ncbi:deoxyribodipyrimidine photo-lyase [Tropicimonas sp. IMCC34043]|uniref:cryptochrome/photolyase family protein n=1 Tax=Tropicimonas sp. IMCC34043 TaxID=2248760 RepID=UPI000E269704|nr:deoxyribodipyrimidine photo-lyase [Tropicimonas sp. IMCC34043]